MQAYVYEGYFNDGKFYNKERQIVEIPEWYRVNITLFGERIDKNESFNLHEKKPFRICLVSGAGEFGCRMILMSRLTK